MRWLSPILIDQQDFTGVNKGREVAKSDLTDQQDFTGVNKGREEDEET
jgi:hypothetical protein